MRSSLIGTLAGMALIAALGTGTAAATPPAEQIARGQYLARAGDCVSCHSSPQAGPFGGGLEIATPFGKLVTPNITPDPATGIGGWTAADLWNALHFGWSKKGYHLYPAMPYVFFTQVTREDVDAIWAYLMSLPPTVYPVDVNQLDFPFDIRLTMAVWNEINLTPGPYVPDLARSERWNRGAYLVEGLGHCGACHTPRNFMEAVEKSRSLTGARVNEWFATNLTSSTEGLGSWSEQDIMGFLKKGGNARMSAVGPMREVIHNSLRFMTDDDLGAIAEYLKSLPSERAVDDFGAGQPIARRQAAALYVANCAGCHGNQGRGMDPDWGPPLAGNPLVLAPDPVDMLNVLVNGITAHAGRQAMAPQLQGVTAPQLAAIVNYVRTAWGNTAPANVTSALVLRVATELQPTAP
jgi:mono/diheme cytochrome c family protein